MLDFAYQANSLIIHPTNSIFCAKFYLFAARKEKWEIGHYIIDAMNLFDFITLWKFCPEKKK